MIKTELESTTQNSFKLHHNCFYEGALKLLQRKLWEISRKIYVIEFPFSKVVSLHSKVYYQFTKFTTGTFLEVQAFWYIVQGILNILDNVQEKLCYVVVFSKLQVFNYSLQPNLGCFKIMENS